MHLPLPKSWIATALVVVSITYSSGPGAFADTASIDAICSDYEEYGSRRRIWTIFERLNRDMNGRPISATFSDAVVALRLGRHREGVMLLAAASFTDSPDPSQRQAASGARLLLSRLMTCDPIGRLTAPESRELQHSPNVD